MRAQAGRLSDWSDWELRTARAAAVLHVIIKSDTRESYLAALYAKVIPFASLIPGYLDHREFTRARIDQAIEDLAALGFIEVIVLRGGLGVRPTQLAEQYTQLARESSR